MENTSAPPGTVDRRLEAAWQLSRDMSVDFDHAQQVNRLALRLFDELQELHALGPQERVLLELAGLLHDIGTVDGVKGHHKASLRIILNTPLLPFTSRERLVVGSIARYHRRALPGPEHDHFAALRPTDQHIVIMLSALLRLADSLDCSHRGIVRDLHGKVTQQKIRIDYAATQQAQEEEAGAKEKGDLLRLIFRREIVLHWQPI